MSLRVVFDTNVLISGVGWSGTPARCLDLALAGQIQGVTCAQIIDELMDKLRNKLRWSDERIDIARALLLPHFGTVVITGTFKTPQPDHDDDMILECAVVAAATHIVTDDRQHLLPMKQFQTIQIVTPAELF